MTANAKFQSYPPTQAMLPVHPVAETVTSTDPLKQPLIERGDLPLRGVWYLHEYLVSILLTFYRLGDKISIPQIFFSSSGGNDSSRLQVLTTKPRLSLHAFQRILYEEVAR